MGNLTESSKIKLSKIKFSISVIHISAITGSGEVPIHTPTVCLQIFLLKLTSFFIDISNKFLHDI